MRRFVFFNQEHDMGYELEMTEDEICDQDTDDAELQAAQAANFSRIGRELADALSGLF